MAQVLLDDEWHAVHQLLAGKSPRQLFLSFGSSDYSIPLGLLYAWESRKFGLTELAMRWPMMAAGLLTLPLFVAWAWTRLSPRVAVIFAFLLAVAPMLVMFSRIARPYALTLLLGWLALFTFQRFFGALSLPGGRAWAWGGAYVVCAALCTWLHPVIGPFVVAPFLVEGVHCLARRRYRQLLSLAMLGLVAGASMAALLLPPLLADLGALGGKSGAAQFSLETLTGVWFAWLGTPSTLMVLVLLLLAALGLPRVLKVDALPAYALTGLAGVLVAVLVLEPRWAQVPHTLARYLLPLLPLLLLAVAVGIDRLLALAPRYGPWRQALVGAACIAVLGVYAWQSPSRAWVARPNTQGNHALFRMEFRPSHDPISAYQDEHIPVSDFWARLADSTGGPVAAGPFHFESYNWAAPRWERASGRAVLPLALGDTCAGPRRGEAPRAGRVTLRNVVYPGELGEVSPPVAWVVLTRPFIAYLDGRENQAVGGAEFAACERPLKALLGEPDYEDAVLLAWRLR